jgi:hypothetical protein
MQTTDEFGVTFGDFSEWTVAEFDHRFVRVGALSDLGVESQAVEFGDESLE